MDESSCQDKVNICDLDGSIEPWPVHMAQLCLFLLQSLKWKLRGEKQTHTHTKCLRSKSDEVLKGKRKKNGKKIKCWCVLEGTVITMLVYSPLSTFLRMFSHSRVQCPHTSWQRCQFIPSRSTASPPPPPAGAYSSANQHIITHTNTCTSI